MLHRIRVLWSVILLSMVCIGKAPAAQEAPAKVEVKWDHVIRVSKTVPTILYIGTPLTARGTSLHDPMLERSRTVP